MSEDLKKQLETAQAVIARLDAKKATTRGEIEALEKEITAALLADDPVDELITRKVALTRLIPAIDTAMVTAKGRVAELEREAQRQQLADMEQEYASLGNELEASKASLQQYQTVLMPTPGGRLDTNLQPDQKAAMKVKQDAQQAIAGKLETMRRQIDHMKKVVNG